MKARKLFGLGLVVVLVFLVLTNVTSAQGPAPRAPSTALGTGFTYQGQLKQSGTAYTGTCDFKFVLFDAASGGTQITSIQTVTGVSVNAGAFTTKIDFGTNVFNGDSRWLAISVACPSGGAYTALTTRQELTPAPYALTAMKTAYKNVLVVAKSGGNYNTITDALDSITDNTANNRYLIWVAPGTFTERVTLKDYVDIEGAGELATKITYIGSASADTGTVVGSNNVELRFLTVENTGSAGYAIAIYNGSCSPHLTHLTATASGGTSINSGVYNKSSSSPTMTNVTATASGGIYTYGVANDTSSSPTMTNVTATASGGTYSSGVFNDSSSPTMINVTARASGGTTNYGVRNATASSPTMTNVTATALGGTSNHGVSNVSSSPTIQNSTISASGGTNNYGIFNDFVATSIYTVTVNNSQITGSNNTVRNDSHFTVRIGASKLDGGAVNVNGGTVTCIGAYDENYTSPGYTTCP